MSAKEKKYLKIAFAGSGLDIGYAGDSAEGVLAFLFRDVEKPESPFAAAPAAHVIYRLESDPNTGGLRLYAGDELERECATAEDMALHLIGQVCYQLAYFSSGGLVMHAALVSRDGQGILLPGSTGKGKSSLAAWFLRCGYDYLTDELVFVPDGEELIGCGLSRPLNSKKSFRPLLNGLFEIPAGTTGMMSNESVDLIPPELFGNGVVLSHIPICAVILPRYQSGAAFECRQLSKAQAGLELMQCLINARNLPEHGFPSVIHLARSIPAYLMVYSDFSAVEQTVNSILENIRISTQVI